MTTNADFYRRALEFLEAIGVDVERVTPDTNLVTCGLIDSLGILAFLDFLEREWGTEIDIDGSTFEHISTLCGAHQFMATSARST